MSTPAEHNPNSTPAEGADSVYLHRGKVCFAHDKCPESLEHPRQWVSCPNGPERKERTLILCFDGTGDSFDDSVS